MTADPRRVAAAHTLLTQLGVSVEDLRAAPVEVLRIDTPTGSVRKSTRICAPLQQAQNILGYCGHDSTACRSRDYLSLDPIGEAGNT